MLLESGDTRIMIDAGFPASVIADRLAALQVAPESIQAVLVTHEHHDHVKGAASCSRKWGWQIYATAGTRVAATPLRFASVTTIACNSSFEVGDFDIASIPVSHDASEPVAFVAISRSSGTRAAVVYDLGCVSSGLREAIRGADMLVMESNHDRVMLQRGPYPLALRMRIGGRNGHLSNAVSSATVASVASTGLKHVILSHLSEWCNSPQLAATAMGNALSRTEFRGRIVAAPQDSAIGPFTPAKSRGAQLTLGL